MKILSCSQQSRQKKNGYHHEAHEGTKEEEMFLE
jgi:hypothetical protein